MNATNIGGVICRTLTREGCLGSMDTMVNALIQKEKAMKAHQLITVFVLFALLPLLSFGQACVDFQSLAIGTQYGAPGDSPGDVVFTENNIPVSVENFDWVGGGTAFVFCRVDTFTAAFPLTKIAWTNNINLKFDMSGLAFTPNHVSFKFADLGGEENISVNGQPIFAGELTAAPVTIAPGVTFSVATTPIPAGKLGVVILRGPVTSLLVGGQEFFLDDICARDTVVTGIEDNYAFSDQFSLSQNFPNPSNGGTDISFYIPETVRINLQVFSFDGRLVNMLTDALYDAGLHTIHWDGKDSNCNDVTSGMYFYRLNAGEFAKTKAMVLLR